MDTRNLTTQSTELFELIREHHPSIKLKGVKNGCIAQIRPAQDGTRREYSEIADSAEQALSKLYTRLKKEDLL